MSIREDIACPKCKSSLKGVEISLYCGECEIKYPIINNRPILVPWINEDSSRSNELMHAVSSLKEWSKDPFEPVSEKDLKKIFFNEW